MDKIKQAIEFAKQNPESPYANELRKRIENGSLDKELSQAGLSDLYGRPKAQESVLKSIVADPFRTLVEKPATALSRVAALGIAEGADILGKDQFAENLRTTALEKDIPSVIGGKEVPAIKPGKEGAKQIAGEALQIGSYLFPYGKVAGTLGGGTLAKATSGATGGYLQDIGFKLSEGNTDVTPGLATAFGAAVPIIGAGASKVSKSIKRPTPAVEDTIGQIIQGKTKDKQLAQKALSSIDTSDVKTFKELSDKLSSSMELEMSKVDNALAKDTGIYKLDQLAIGVPDNAGNIIKTDYVGEALKNLDELYQTTGDNVSVSNVRLLAQKAVEEGLTRQEVNNIARLYSEEFGSKGYSKLGEALTSVNAQKFENVRSGLKESARAGLGGEEAKVADRLYSAMANTKTLIDKNVEAVNRLKQRITERGTLEKLARGTVRTLDALSGGTLRGAAQAVFPSNMGLKVQNFMQLEENLAKNLELLNKASTAKTESAFVKFLNGLRFPGDEAVDDIGKRIDDFKKLPSKTKQGGYLNVGGYDANLPTSTQTNQTANKVKSSSISKSSPKSSTKSIDPLINEAKKYKSAEEFVKAQGKLPTKTVFNNDTKGMWNNIKNVGDYKIARVNFHNNQWKLVDTNDFQEVAKDSYKPIKEFYSRDELYDFLKKDSKSQLEEIWKKANQQKSAK